MQLVEKLRPDVEQAIREKDKKNAPHLIEMINSLSFELERLEHLIGFIFMADRDFDNIDWRDRNAARGSIERAKTVVYESPSIERIQPIINDLFENGNFGSGGSDEGGSKAPKGILRG